MKKLLNILLLLVLVIGIVGCSSKSKDASSEKESDILLRNNGVSLKIKEGTLTKTSATVILSNKSYLTVGYGKDYFIEKEEDGKWYELENISDRVFELPLYHLKPYTSKELNISLNYGYKELSQGKYRIVKGVFFMKDDENTKEFYVAAEFNID